jgi:hypothetical protein
MKMAKQAQETSNISQVATKEARTRGLLFSLLAIPAGIILWVIAWKLGFIASIVAFIISYLAVWLYKYGSRSNTIGKDAAPWLVAIIIGGVMLAFISGMASDAIAYYVEQMHVSETQSLFSGDFWSLFFANLFGNGELWAAYTTDIFISVGFGALGSYAVIREMLAKPQPEKAMAE